MRAAVLLLVLLGMCFPASCLDIEDATQTVLTEQGSNIVLVIMFTALIIAAAYMIGTTINEPRYIVFAKDEAYHLGFSVLLLVAIGGVLVFSCLTLDMFYVSLFQNLEGLSLGCYAPGAGMNTVSSCYIDQVKRDATDLSERYIDGYIRELMDSTYTYTIQIPLLNAYSSSAGAYRRVISNQYDLILNSFLVPALMSISMQKIALDFINENVISWILPSAFILRIFIPTRQMGNILIALAIGLYIIVPFMFVFNFAMYDAVFTDCMDYQEAVYDKVVDGYSSANTCDNPEGFWNVARLIPQAFFLPNLTIAILVTFLGAANKALRVIG